MQYHVGRGWTSTTFIAGQLSSMDLCIYTYIYTLLLFNIAMENPL